MSVKKFSAQRKAEQLNFGFQGFSIGIAGDPTQSAGVAQWTAKWEPVEVFRQGRWVVETRTIEDKTPSAVIARAWEFMIGLSVWRRPDKRVARFDPATYKVEFIDVHSEHFPKEAAEAQEAATSTEWPPVDFFDMPEQYAKLNAATLDSNVDPFSLEEGGDTLINEVTARILRIVLAYKQAGVEPDGELAAKWQVLQDHGFSFKADESDKAMTIEEVIDYTAVTQQMNAWAKGISSW